MKHIITLIFAFFALTSCGFNIPNHDYPALVSNTEKSIREANVLPVFIQPSIDISNKNELRRVFAHYSATNNQARLELTLVFADEDHPTPIADFFYDIYRTMRYNRITDVETIILRYNTTNTSKMSIEYKNVYASNQAFDSAIHLSSTISRNKHKHTNGRPIIYINTWNHMFSEKDTNPKMTKTTFSSYSIYAGNRKKVESFFANKN